MAYSFSGHQTFPFRYTWLPKAVRALQQDPEVFGREDALVVLGVGKNMVASIRFWCQATGIAGVDTRSGKGYIKPLGIKLFGPGGWDPYLEDPATLWVLHWHLVEAPRPCSTWFLVFSRWNREEFTRAELVDWLATVAEKSGNRRVSRASIKRDVDVFLRTYVPAVSHGRRPVEDTFDCPLVDLGLIREVEDGLYGFVRGSKPTLPIEVFLYALGRFWDRDAPDQNTLAFERVLYGPGSPGAAFKLTDSALASLLTQLPAWSGVRYDETAGLRILLRQRNAAAKPIECLEHYYSKRPSGAA